MRVDSKSLINVGNIKDCMDCIEKLENILNRLNILKSEIEKFIANDNLNKAAIQQIHKEDTLNYRLCEIFIDKVEKYLKEFELVYTDEIFIDTKTRYLEKNFLITTIKIFIQDMEKTYNITI